MSATESGKMIGRMSVRRQLESTPSDPYPVPEASGTYVVNSSVINGMFLQNFSHLDSNLRTYCGNLFLALPITGTKVLRALHYGESLWGMAAKIITQLPGGATENYFLKVNVAESDGESCSSYSRFRS